MADEEIRISIAEIQKDIKTIYKKTDEFEKKDQIIMEISKTLHELTLEVSYLRKDFDNTFIGLKNSIEVAEKKIDAIEKEPGEKWKKFVWIVITGIVSAIVGYFIAQMGM